MSPPVVLTVAGSDSGGGAGIHADLKTFHAFGCFGTSAITAITAQNTLGVTAIHPVPEKVVRAQIDAVASDLKPVALKSGMLATRALVQTVGGAIRDNGLRNYVLDPVMVASSGDRLLDVDAERAIADHLLPLAAVVTPNLDEAAILTEARVTDLDEMRRAAERLVELGAQAALVKGGHLEGEEIVDILYDGRDWKEWRRPKRRTRNTHGTGCTLSAGIAACLGRGAPLAEATEDALEFLQRALETAPGLGSGHGPVNHLISPPPLAS